MIPRRRLAEAMRDLFSAVVSPGTVSAVFDSGAGRFSGFAGHVGASAAETAVKNAAENGFRVDGRLCRVHVVFTEFLSFFRLGESRGYDRHRGFPLPAPAGKGNLRQDSTAADER